MRFTCAVVAAIAAGVLGAAEAPVGFLGSGSGVSVDGRITGNGATLFGDTLLETGASTAMLHSISGTAAELARHSKGRVYADRLLLLAGAVRVAGSAPYSVESAAVQVRPSRGGTVDVSVADGSTTVSSRAGTAEVRNRNGVLVAMVPPGSNIRFSPSESGGNTARVSGILKKSRDRYLLRDETTHLTVELRGPGLDRLVGARVEVRGQALNGALPAKGTSQVIAVSQARSIGAAAAAAGGKAAPAAVASGVGKGTLAVLGGLTAAATVGTLYAADAVQGESEPSASIP